ncbi:quinolinate synthase NadA [Clostridium sp. D2Q-11]|uniref:Quinolinate synthase n=1 Tax=Anaeromonas frigoriresistens TaxID=2683708 RepID=A0A942Z857_9FIRM|nr:quinolinate synthase NadA [Anaeromonas frigoriresistens]MBS4537624.1 quinolinate synthase NadA [Anaeromonas frigoriresistens]
MTNQWMVNEINKIKKEKKALILAHNYQIPEVQEVADIVGDSLALSKAAAEAKEEIIVFCGVHFMAESAKILSPEKKILLPAIDAGCPMADMVTAYKLKEYKKNNPNTAIVCYVNSSAEVKAESDVCCTSSNALKVVNSLEEDKIMFVPDKNLGNFIKGKVKDKEVEVWPGFCITHHRVKGLEIDRIREAQPDAEILVHPECNKEVVEKADFIGSTSQIINYARKSNNKKFIIGTEMGVLHKLEKENPDKKFYLLSPGLICTNMKKTSLEDVYNALKEEKNSVLIEEDIRKKALKPLNRMLSL